MVNQPYLHDLHAAVAAPVQAWFAPDGQVRAHGAQGWYVADTRAVARAVVTVGDVEPEPVGVRAAGPGRLVASFIVRNVGGNDADPAVRLDRHLEVTPAGVSERYVLSCATPGPVTTTLTVQVRPDATGMDAIRVGGALVGCPAMQQRDDEVRWALRPGLDARLRAPGATYQVDATAVTATWPVTVSPGHPATFGLTVAMHDPDGVVRAPSTAAPEWSRPEVETADRRLAAWLDRALDDVAGLRMSARFAPDDVFLAAGAPWFFTLFGRDSLWAARMMLPLGTELAAGTLRTLAARQGTRLDAASAEAPGKILHEVRRDGLAMPDDGMHLPPLYYGTVDATALWVTLLHDAWRWGMPPEEVAPLIGPLEAALAWLSGSGDPDGDGFLEYIDTTGHGLSNQGWKDSGDSVQWRDGRLADAPIALVEVQGYAYEAAVKGADLLDAFGRPGADRWRTWAADLRTRFRGAFWVDSPDGAYPGIALDRDKRLVDSVTSNMGHLLGTGILDPDEERLVAERLVRPDMTTATGLRTLAEGSGGYWPLRYHGGAIWPHDTAVVLAGMAAGGHTGPAGMLTRGLLSAAETFRHQLPELWSGEDGAAAVPYPAACHPQAWSAAASVVVLSSALGLRPDVPNGVLHIEPPSTGALGALRVRGLRIAGRPLDISIDGDEIVAVTDAPVTITHPRPTP
ncbi:MAG: amylo-alpha-1,6-glucosidase [Actinobacteria bacterium]|nr:amylo-alpha-1,6-glucosidase [Actinomycetota bacterium]MCG2802480.1 amylo-alpha-1,6-glucosidase [Cellulomonas sp.]